jgi:hypothetical protein
MLVVAGRSFDELKWVLAMLPVEGALAVFRN